MSVLFHGLVEDALRAATLPPDLQAAVAEYRRVYQTYEPADARYLRLHTGHLMWIRPEEERFVTPELIRAGTLTATVDELRDRIRALASAGYDQLAIQLVPGHERALDDWANVVERL